MSYIENFKQYTGSTVANTFFIPMLSGKNAEQLGVKVLYNMPVPTIVTTLTPNENILQKYTQKGWTGGNATTRINIEIPMSRVKAENAYSADDYFSIVYERISTLKGMNLDDLSGTELEQAETEIFREALMENIRANMWLGDTTQANGLNSFDGFLKSINTGMSNNEIVPTTFTAADLKNPAKSIAIFRQLWLSASDQLRALKSDANLAIYCTSDLCELYEEYLDSVGVNTSYQELVGGRPQLSYHGIPIIDMRFSSYAIPAGLSKSMCMLTDRRNLVMAVNTQDMPGNEVRMWYNPDEMENRQRAIFMAGCEVLDTKLVAVAKLA